MLLIVIPLAALVSLSPTWVEEAVDWLFNAALVGCVAYLAYLFWDSYRSSKRNKANEELHRKQAEEWKQRIRSAADNIELKGHQVSFEQMCQWEEEEVLEQILVELKSMPQGRRSLAKAYSTALKKTDIPPFKGPGTE